MSNSNPPPVSPPLTGDKAPAVVSRKLLDYTLESPLKTLGSAVSIVGGLLLLVFLADIEFLPDLDLGNAAAMLYAVALLGLTLLACFAGLLVFPGLMMRTYKASDQGGRGVALVAMTGRQRHAARVLSSLPWLVAFLACAGLLLYGFFKDEGTGWRWGIAVGTLLAICVLVAGTIGYVRRTLEQPLPHGLLNLLFEVFLSVLALALPAYVILQLTAVGEMAKSSSVWEALLTILVLFLLSAVAACLLANSAQPLKAGTVVMVGFGMLFFVMMLTRSTTVAPHAAVRKLGLGDVAFARIALTSAGCRQVNAALGSAACTVPAEADAVMPLCPVRIRSRIGQQLVLEFGDVMWNASDDPRRWTATWAETGQRMRRVVVDKSQMPSWQPLRAAVELPAPPASAASSAGRVTLWRGAAGPGGEALTQLCEARIEPVAVPAPPVPPASTGSAASAASSPAGAPPPPQAVRG